ncbi:MAG: PHP domain-containing protein [Gammaproteobacteria bacterium]|nr:PHP domain-containing protein [Gammaproteobacteria bacterium]
MKIDLHCHSYLSDGKHSPEFLLQRARENEISHLAITDHDCVAGYEQLNRSISGIKLIPGVEISCDWEKLEVHVIGLCLDVAHAGLQDLLATQQQQRRLRMQEMDRKLQALGTEGLWQYLESLPCIAYTRSHAADFLVQQGVCKNRQQAFKSHLGKKGRIYAESGWCTLDTAVNAILAAGGIAILAHPGRYPLSKRKLEALIDVFQAAGGDGMEVSYGNIDPDMRQRLGALAISKQLFCSAGSDFHDSDASWTDLGKYPPLDLETKKNAIWLHPRWHC